MSDVFQRQRGLVDQAKLSKLAIRFANKAAFPQQFIESFELIGQQLGINQFCHNQQKVSKDIDEYTLNWANSSRFFDVFISKNYGIIVQPKPV